MDKKRMEMTCKEGLKDAFERYLKDVNREGINDLIEWLDKTGFYDAPASGSYHLAKEGGLVEHSLNVTNLAVDLNKHMGEPVEKESVIIAAALHDLGKHQYYGKDYYKENILKSGNRSSAKPWARNRDLINVPHEIISIQIASRFIDLTEEETWAILHHNGLYGDLKYNLMGKESKLQMIVHFADMWASRVIEEVEE